MAMSHAQRFLYLNSLIKRCYCARLMTWHLCCFIFISHCVSLTNILRFSAKEKKKVVQKKEKLRIYSDLSLFLSHFACSSFFHVNWMEKLPCLVSLGFGERRKKQSGPILLTKKTVLKSIKKDLQCFWRQTFKPILFSST